MPVRRGDVVLVFVAAITSNTSRVREPHQMLIDVSTKDFEVAHFVRLRPHRASSAETMRSFKDQGRSSVRFAPQLVSIESYDPLIEAVPRKSNS